MNVIKPSSSAVGNPNATVSKSSSPPSQGEEKKDMTGSKGLLEKIKQTGPWPLFKTVWFMLLLASALTLSVALLSYSYLAKNKATVDAARGALRQAETSSLALTYIPAVDRQEAILALTDVAGILIEIAPATDPFTPLPSKVDAHLRDSFKTKAKLASERNGNVGVWVGYELEGEQVLWAYSPVEHVGNGFYKIGIWVLSGSTILALLLSWPFAKLLTMDFQRLPKVAQSFERTSEGRLDEKSHFTPERSFTKEAQEAQQAIARMGERLAEQHLEREMSLAALAHDLKSPITRLRLASEVETEDALRQSALQESLLMERLISGFVELARSRHASVDLVNFPACIPDFIRRAQKESIPISWSIPKEGVWVRANGALIQRALMNFLDNAKLYGSGVSGAQFKLVGGKLILSVIDQAKNQAPNAKTMYELVAPFKRADASRSTPGAGLGLAISAQAAALGSGSLVFENTPAGLSCQIEMPTEK